MHNQNFKPGQTCVRTTRQTREFGRVLEVIRGRVIMLTTREGSRDQGVETFIPAHDMGWRLCG